MVICIAFGVALVPVCERLDRVFSPPESGAKASQAEVPALTDFSSPSSEVASNSFATFTVTAYCPCEICCGKWADGYTASGATAVGQIVAAPSTIPFGTVLEIPGYGVAVVQDRGAAITEGRLDVLFTDKDSVSGHQRALNWGAQELVVREVK